MLHNAIALIGPPAAGKTTLAMHLQGSPGIQMFRLREQLPKHTLTSAVSTPDNLDWIDDTTVMMSMYEYVHATVREHRTHSLIFDNFPGTATQSTEFLSILQYLAPSCVVHLVELAANPVTLQQRAADRRVCGYCERDPLGDPRLPTTRNMVDPHRCAKCNNILSPRRGDASHIYRRRLERYCRLSTGVRNTFAEAGISVGRLDGERPIFRNVDVLKNILSSRVGK